MLPTRGMTVLFPNNPVLCHHPTNPPAAFLTLRCDTAPAICLQLCLQLGRKTKRLPLMMSKREGVDSRAITTIFHNSRTYSSPRSPCIPTDATAGLGFCEGCLKQAEREVLCQEESITTTCHGS